MRKTVKFVYCGKELECKGTSISKEEGNKTQELHRSWFGGDEFASEVYVLMFATDPPRQPH